MSKNKKANEINIDTSAFGILTDLEKKKEQGEKLDEYTEEALDSVRIASDLMNIVLSGKQVDLEAYRLMIKERLRRLRALDKKNGVNRTIKTRIEGDKKDY